MSPFGITDDQYKVFLKAPRSTKFSVKAEDIVAAGKPGLLELFKQDKLRAGFEMPPPLTIDEDPDAAETVSPGENPWDQVILKTYLIDGSITYRELDTGMFEASVYIPPE